MFVLRYRRDLGLWHHLSPLSVRLTASSARIDGVVLPQGNLAGQVNVVVDADIGAKVSDSQLVDKPPLFGESPADSNGGVTLGPTPDPGPEFDYEVYALNTMVGYEPPPPPRIPFGGPFEDYYDEYVGVDYVPKQEKPTSSFLMFLDSLNEKRAEEEAKLREKDPSRPPFDPKPNKNLFAGSKPLFTISRPTHPAPLPRDYTPRSLDPLEPTPRRTIFPPSVVHGRPIKKKKPVGDGVEHEVPAGVKLPIDLEDVPSDKPVAKPDPVVHQSGVVEEFSPTFETSTTLNASTSNEIKDTSPPLSAQTQPDTSVAATRFSPSPQAQSPAEVEASSAFTTSSSRLAEGPTFGERPLSPSLRPTGNDVSSSPLSPSPKPSESPSSRPLSPSTRPLEAPVDASGSSFPQTRSVGEAKDFSRQSFGSASPLFDSTSAASSPVEESSPFVPQGGPMEESKGDRPSIFQSKPIEGSSSFVSQGRAQEEVKEERPFIFQRKSVEESKPIFSQSRPLEETRVDRPFSFQERNMEENKLPQPQTMPPGSRQYTPTEAIYATDRPLSPQTQPAEGSSMVAQGQPLNQTYGGNVLPPQSVPLDMNRGDNQGSSAQIDGTIQPPFSGQAAAVGVPGMAPITTQFYEPVEGDIVLGVVIYANEDELGLEIGGRVPALMTMREFQPLAEIGDNDFFKIPLDDGGNETLEGFTAPSAGKVMLVEDKAANDGIYRGENVSVGTIVIAAVQSRDLIDGRPVVTCRRLAKSLAFVRIEQLMRTGEPIQLKISQYNDGGLQGYLEGIRAFLPRSELIRRPENSAVLQEYIGKTLTVAILQAEEYASNVIISEVKPWMSKNLLLGSVHNLTITRIYPYGLQAEIENTRVRGFIHISNITRGYVTSLNASFVEGEKIKAMVIRGRKPGQLSFSIEALEPPSDEGMVLRDKEQVFDGAEEIATSSQEYQLPLEERRVFVMPYASTSVNVRDSIANLPWLQL